jgi:hypothetical protein
LTELLAQGIQRAAHRTAAQALPVTMNQMHTEVWMAALSLTVRVVMERTPEGSPLSVRFHPNRGSQYLFGGGEEFVHVFFYGLLCEDLCAQQMGEDCQETAKPVVWLTGGDGDQDEQPDEGSHTYSPFVDGLNPSRGMA